jgi:4-hydroxy-3-methylbut-2-enyl diphosphate reductase IspH
LQHKALQSIDEQRFMPPAARKMPVQVARTLGMDSDARAALARVQALARSRKTAVTGTFMPDSGVSALLASQGIAEHVEEADFFQYRRVVVPYCGISPRMRRDWEEASYPLEDLTSPQVRRAQVALGLLRMEGAQGLVIGRHEDPESLALAGGSSGTKIVQDTTDTARLLFSPAFGVVCQTTLSPRRIEWLVQQLRFRYRDARVTFLDTVSPSMALREEALERILVTCDRAVIVGRVGEASCEALVETALRRGKPATVVEGPEDLEAHDFAGSPKIALSAGAFALDETIRAVAEALGRM